MIEREIGEVFTYHVPDAPMGIKLQVVKDDLCMDCEFEHICPDHEDYVDFDQIGPCIDYHRKDNKNVKFIRLGKA